jgi:hypothetical protein
MVQNLTRYICCLCSPAIFTDIFNSFADTCWRRDTDSESDEEPPPAKRQRTTDPQTNRTGGAHDGGQQFEIKMAAVIGLRGLESGDNFELATNVTNAGNFDDIVYTAGGWRYFLQLKHTENPDTTHLQPKDLVELLHKCFESYYEMEDKDKSEFIIYTNKRLGRMLSSHERNDTADSTVESVFKTSTKGEIFNFTRDDNKKIDVYSGVEKLVKGSKQFGDLSVAEQNYKVGMINEFLEKLIMVISQKGQQKLDKVIYKEIKKRDEIKVCREVNEQVIRYFKMRLETWWRNKNEKMTPETLRNWLQEAKTKACASVVRSLFKSCTKTLVGTGMRFSDSEISQLQTELSDKRAVHLRSDALTLCSILLPDCLDTTKCIFVTFESLQSNKDMLLYAWLGGHWGWLVVFCDSTVQQSDISDTCLEIYEIIKRGPSSKHAIILTLCSVQQISNFVPIEHEFNFEQLSVESQGIVLDKKIDFQGCEVTMRSVLEQHGNVEHVLGHELVTDMITEETPVNIGGRLYINEGYYAPRALERRLWLDWNVLWSTNTYSNVFAVSRMKEKDLTERLPSGKAVESTSSKELYVRDLTKDTSIRIFLLAYSDVENSFLEICERLEGKSLHWLDFKNGDLLWKKSSCGTDSLLDYIDTDKTRADRGIIAACMKRGSCEVNEGTVLVVDEPGMGKSSTTTQVAWHTKLADPTSWVVRINWNDHSRELQKIIPAAFNFDSLVAFLCSAAFPNSKYTDIDRILLKQALQNSGNITVLMDGFDEISPIHADKAAAVLCELMKTKVGRVWVTSRPVEKERLEIKLSVFAFSMKKVSRMSQEELLLKHWISKAGGKESDLVHFIRRLLGRLNLSVSDENFTGSPLYITMISTVYEMDVETHLNSKYWTEQRIDLVDLYEIFIERKLHIYVTEKQKADITNSSVIDDLEYLKQIFFKNFEKCALVDILPPSMLKSLHNKKIEEEIQTFLGKVQAGKDKRGIVMNVIEGKPQFVHRTFAEYFTARWFSRNFEFNRSIMEHILFDPAYTFMRGMLHRMLAKHSPLHCAALEWDDERFETLLEEGCDVSALDKGGRTVMHIISQDHGLLMVDPEFYKKVLLVKRDNVLRWTPMQYAIKSEKWFIVERLLESNVDSCGLDMIRHKAHDPQYSNTLILHAAENGHVLLLEFLCSIGVNIHQAGSRRYPSTLHAAIQEEQLKVVKWLIKQGADCNTPYSDGQKPLLHAVTESSLDVVRALVEEGGASLDVHDYCGGTIIDWINNYASDPKNSVIIIRKRKVERLNEIVKYLKLR